VKNGTFKAAQSNRNASEKESYPQPGKPPEQGKFGCCFTFFDLKVLTKARFVGLMRGFLRTKSLGSSFGAQAQFSLESS
jgi:hypothetical protein